MSDREHPDGLPHDRLPHDRLPHDRLPHDRLSDEQARRLLDLAAATIPHPAPRPMPSPAQRRWRGPALVAAAAAVVAVAAVIAPRVVDDGPRTSTTSQDASVVVPELRGLSGEAAAAALNRLGLPTTRDTAPACGIGGRVIDQEPGAGIRVEPGETVRFTIDGYGFWDTDCPEPPTTSAQRAASAFLGQLRGLHLGTHLPERAVVTVNGIADSARPVTKPDPATWQIECSLDVPLCDAPIDLLDLARASVSTAPATEDRVGFTVPGSRCLADPAVLAWDPVPSAERTDRVVALAPTRAGCDDYWEIRIAVDTEGEISHLDLALPDLALPNDALPEHLGS